jgi:hypothetical protein
VPQTPEKSLILAKLAPPAVPVDVDGRHQAGHDG